MLEPEILISSKALNSNLRVLQKQAHQHSKNKKLFPVIKANAYGHGLELIALHIEKSFSDSEIPLICVARIKEALRLRNAGVSRPLLVLSQTLLEQQWLEESAELRSILDIHWVVNGVQDLEELLRLKSKGEARGISHVHLNFNTGMNRLGIPFSREESDWVSLMKAVSRCHTLGVKIAGLMTHMARGEELPSLYSSTQMERFEACLSQVDARWNEKLHGEFPKWIHCENSGAMARDVLASLKKEYSSRVNACRPGLHVWGVASHSRDFKSLGLQKVLEVRAPLRQVFLLSQGESVGYGGSFVCQRPTLLGTISMGYADGVLRSFSNHNEIGFYIDQIRVPIVGKISMDLLSVDLTDHPKASQWREKIKNNESIQEWAYWICENQSAQKIADACGSIPYEVLCALAQRVQRKIKEESSAC